MRRASLWIPIAVAFFLSFLPLRAAKIGQDGGIELTVSFEQEFDGDSNPTSLPVPLDDANAQQHYCDTFQAYSEWLYRTTEGAHWIKKVRFFEKANVRDIRWYLVEDKEGSAWGRATHNELLSLWEGTYLTSDPAYPYNPPATNAGGTLNHEGGHFLYGLPDEYINFTYSGGGSSGYCDDGVFDGLGAGTVCDDEAFQCGGASCVFSGQCIAGDEAAGTACAADDDCGANGLCLGGNPDRDDVHADSKVRICLHDNNLSAGDVKDGVCLMAGGGERRRWCDGGLDDEGVQIADANHVYTADDLLDYGTDVAYDLGNTAGAPDGSDGNRDYVGYSCWELAETYHPDLAGVHDIGVYPTLAEIVADAGEVPVVECEWLVDGLGADASIALLVDKSGSMSYLDLSDPPKPSVDQAIDGALFFYNEVATDRFAGVYVYDTSTDVATSGGTDLPFADKTGNLTSLDPVVAGGDTDIAEAIDRAHDDILATAGVPASTRNIVIFSDGKHNNGGDPYVEAQQACADDIDVHTISYGDADSSALEQLAACGTSWVTGTEEATVAGFGEPDPLEVKTSLARMAQLLRGKDEVLESRGYLPPIVGATEDTRTFHVPAGTTLLKFSWLANRTCVVKDSQSGICTPVLNLLPTVELISPGGQHFTATATGAPSSGVYRVRSVSNPMPGTWTARVSTVEPVPPPSNIPSEWGVKVPKTKVSWVAAITHPGLEGRAWVGERRVPLDRPVAIHAAMSHGNLLTRIEATATVTHRGSMWSIPMFDDGTNGDPVASDGTYTGLFNPLGNMPGVTSGAYRVKVRMQSQAGVSIPVPPEAGEETVEELPLSAAGTATVEAETAFRLSAKYGTSEEDLPLVGEVDVTCPDLTPGQMVTFTARVDGLAIAADTTRISLGADVGVDLLSVSCPACSETLRDPVPTATLIANVPLDAEPGWRTAWVQVGMDRIRAKDACRVCTPPGTELCNGNDDDCDGLIDEDASGVDTDHDDVANACDNCPGIFNPEQTDADHNGIGDRCDFADGTIWITFGSHTRLNWQPEAGYTWWNVYRGDLETMKRTGVYTQKPGSNPIAKRWCGVTPLLLEDFDPLAPGAAAFYLVTGESSRGEGSLGTDSSGRERPNTNPCP